MGEKVIAKTIDVKQTLAAFKKLLATDVAKVPPAKFRLFYEAVNSYAFSEELKVEKFKFKKLHHLPVQDGDRFYIIMRG